MIDKKLILLKRSSELAGRENSEQAGAKTPKIKALKMKYKLYFDCSAGAAGDMLLGSLLSLLEQQQKGAIASWQAAMAPLLASETGGHVEIKEVVRSGIKAAKIAFFVGHTHADSFERGDSHSTKHSHHAHQHSHPHKHTHEHHGSGASTSHHAHRAFAEIRHFIEQSATMGNLSAEAAALGLQIYTTLAAAEAAAHSMTVETVQFHEVGAFDAIMDILGFSIAYSMLSPISCLSTPVALGSGKVNTSHGLLDVPTPAVKEVLRQGHLAVTDRCFPGECLTPTGAAILATVVNEWLMPESCNSEAKGVPIFEGCGAGTRETAHPNVVKASLLPA